MSKRKVGNCEALKGFGLYQNALGTGLRYQVPNIFPLYQLCTFKSELLEYPASYLHLIE